MSAPSPAKRRHGFTPICPKCGSVRCETMVNTTKAARMIGCLDCRHAGRAATFDQTVVPGRHTNDAWRDGAALSMDGIEG